MKFLLTIIFTLALIVACNAQPKSDYQISSDPVPGASKYHFFLQKDGGRLIQGMDYLQPDNVSDLKIGESANPIFDINLDNDGSLYVVGIVAENSIGIYSGMGINSGNVGTVPSIPGNVKFEKKE